MRMAPAKITLALLLAGCSAPHPDATAPAPARVTIQRIMVSPDTAPCKGVGSMTCLQVKQPGELDWRLQAAAIEGFNPTPGVASLLLVRERQVADPPADAPDRIWVLQETIAQDTIPPTQAAVLERLRGTAWRLRRVDPDGGFGEAWRSSGQTLTFDAKSASIAGSGGCNRWFSAWSIKSDGKLASEPFGSTQMACPEPEMAIEAAYLGLLGGVATIRWWGTELELVTGDGTRLLYEPLLE